LELAHVAKVLLIYTVTFLNFIHDNIGTLELILPSRYRSMLLLKAAYNCHFAFTYRTLLCRKSTSIPPHLNLLYLVTHYYVSISLHIMAVEDVHN